MSLSIIDVTFLLVSGTTGLSLILIMYTPFSPTLLVDSMSTIFADPDVGITPKFMPSPRLTPTWAGLPPRPLTPPSASPVVYWISPSAYKNIA